MLLIATLLIRWSCFLHEAAGADTVTNYWAGTWEFKKVSGGKVGSGGDKVEHSLFKMELVSVWLEEEPAQFMLNSCFYNGFIYCTASKLFSSVKIPSVEGFPG